MKATRYHFILGIMILCLILINSNIALSQSDSSWQEVIPATKPSGRSDMGFVYDSDRHIVIAVGGVSESNNVLLNETWEYDGKTWIQKFTSQTPGARRRPSIAYDPVRHVTVLFGGSTEGDTAFFNDTWEYDGNNWVKRSIQNPPSLRNGAIMEYDYNQGKMLLFGGYYYDGNMTFYDETWEYDGIRWTQLFPSNHPTTRETASMIYDTNLGRIVLFGGGQYAGSVVFNDTWVWDGNNWSQLIPLTSPPARWAQAMIYDQKRSRIVLFGGLIGMYDEFNDTWEFDSKTNTWIQTSPSVSPSGRWGHGMAYDPINNMTVMFGGSEYTYGYLNKDDIWKYSVASVEPQRPVVLLPGFGGSLLYSRPVNGCNTTDEEIWINLLRLFLSFPNNSHLQALHLLNDGYSADNCNRIEAPKILYTLRDLENFALIDDFYETLVINLADYSYKVTPCPYDWRRSITGSRYTSAYQYDLPQRVDQCVEAARAGNPNTQVDIIGHSMGGLVARQYILSKPEYAKKVHSIVSLGTPYWGTPKVFAPLRYGLTTIDSLDPIINDDRIKEIAINSPSVYQILPSKTFFEQVGSYFASIGPDGINDYPSYDTMLNFLKLNFNGTLADLAQNLHTGAFDDWRNDVLAINYYVFVGTGLDTPRWILEQKSRDWGGTEKLTYIPFNLPHGGDGTVVEQSAALEGTFNNFTGDAVVCRFPNVNHGGLTSDPNVWVKIDNALKGLPVDCPQSTQVFTSSFSPIDESSQLVVDSGASVQVWDEQRRHAGPNSSGIIEGNIPLVTYITTGDQTVVGLPPVSTYTITLQMTDTIPAQVKFFTLIPGSTLTEVISQTIVFQDVPSTIGGQATIVYNPLATPSMYHIDVDSNKDGITDVVIFPTKILDHQNSVDFIPPHSSILIQGKSDPMGYFTGLVTVTLEASDMESGIYKIEYSLDGGVTGQVYKAPFKMLAESVPVLYVKATDLAGNTENPWVERRLRPPYALHLPLLLR